MSVETREKILKAAASLFSEKGYAAVRTKEIAEAAGVNEVTLFRCFGNKRAVYHETFKKYIVRPTPEYLLDETTGDPRYDLPGICDSIVYLFNKNSSLIQMSYKAIAGFDEIVEELHNQPEQMVRIMTLYFKGIVEEKKLKKSPERLARYFVTSIFGTAFHYIHHPELQNKYLLKDCLNDFLDNFLAGLECCIDSSSES